MCRRGNRRVSIRVELTGDQSLQRFCVVIDLNIAAGPSVYPVKKYCDLTGYEVRVVNASA